MLDLNITILIQLVNFLISVFVLNILLVKPIRGILAERRSKMDDIQGKADAFNADADKRMANYQAALQSARHDATKLREEAKESGVSKQQTIMQDAAQKAQEILAETQAAIKAEAAAATIELKKQVKALANQVVGKILN